MGRDFLRQKSKGFTLIEVIFTILIISIALVGAFSLLSQTLASTTDISSTLIAAYLGQEGIEIVRNFRDGNWLEQRANPDLSWTDRLAAGDWEADYNDASLTSYTGRYLKIDNNGFYNYDSGTETKFKRKITITPDGDDILKVLVLMEWQEKGRTYQISVQENLYNWLGR